MRTINRPQQGKLDPIRSRATARVFVAILVALVAGLGIWGSLAAIEGVQSYQHAKRLQSAVEQARFALALERSAIREPEATPSSPEVRSTAAAFARGVRLIRNAGGESDRKLAALVGKRHGRFVEAAGGMFAARAAGNAGYATQLLQGTVEPQAGVVDEALAEALVDVRGRQDPLWPSASVERLALGGIALLFALGLATCAVFLMRLAGYRRRLERGRRDKLSKLEQAARSDSLTGLGNHRAFYDDLKREITRRANTGSYFSVVMFDLDGLKETNDTLGHQAGDERIRGVAECLRETLREPDGAYRTGGDEFMALLPGERAWGGLMFAQRLQGAASRKGKAISVSCGIVESAALESASSLVRRADIALYEAKRTGRRVVVYSDGISPKPTDRPEDLAARRHHRLLATALAQAVDAKDSGTRNHCETVSALCVLIGEAVGLEGERIEQLRLAGLLHDVGKIGIPDFLLQKPLGLDADERQAMSAHVEIGQVIVAAAGLEEEANWIRHHHEHVDGSGYPDGLAGSMIPIESRIILVADAFEAMTADRPYRDARKPAEALAELERRAGTQFDAECVEALRSILGSDRSGLGSEKDRVFPRLATLDESLKVAASDSEPKAASV